MTKEQILQILKAHFIYSKIAEKITNEIMELADKTTQTPTTSDNNPEEPSYTEEEEAQRKVLLKNIPF